MNNNIAHEGKRSTVVWPLGIILAIVPLVVRLREMKLQEVVKDFWDNGSGTYADFFSANKLVLLGLAVIVGVLLFAREYIKELDYRGTKFEKPFYKNKLVYGCIIAYTALATLSTLFASKGEKGLALIGAPGRYEGLIAILFYMLSMFLAIYVSQEWWNIKALYKFLVVGASIMGIIGAAQFVGFDIYQTDGMKALMLPYKYSALADQIVFAFDGRVYATLFNPNYVGSYAALLVPISVVGMIYTFLHKKGAGDRLKATLFVILMLILWFSSYSRGGLLGGAFALLIISIFLFKDIIRTKVQATILIILVVVLAVGANTISKGRVAKQVFSLPKEAADLFLSDKSDVRQLDDIKLEQSAVEITSNLPLIRIEKDGDELTLKDSVGNIIPYEENEGKLVPQDSNYTGMHVAKNIENGFQVNIANPDMKVTYRMRFMQTAEGMLIEGTNGILQDVEPVEAFGFKGKEKLGSSRGYIWSRTLPMIKDTWLLGYGPDTYVIKFPQHDVIGKTNSGGSPRIVVDKPHNLYLQTVVSTGLVSLFVLVVLFGIYFVLWVRHIRSLERDDIRRWMSIGIFAALCGYLVAGLFNDSVVAVAPLFWVLWGLGIGLTNLSPDQKLS